MSATTGAADVRGLCDQLDQARERAHDEVIRLCAGGRWTMRVPVDEERDSDTVIVAALDGMKKLTAAVRAVLDLADDLDADNARLAAVEWRSTDGRQFADGIRDGQGFAARAIRAAIEGAR